LGIILDQPDQIGAYYMLSQLGALKLEIAGLKHSSGRSIAKHIRDTYGLECGRLKTDVYDAFQRYLIRRGVLRIESLLDTELIRLYIATPMEDKAMAELILAEYKRRGWVNDRKQTTPKYKRAIIAKHKEEEQ